MISILKEIDITQVFNNFLQKKCFNHKKRMASSVCLHEDCWKSESDQAFFCIDCIVDHERKHGDLMRCNALFTDELLEELDEYQNNSSISAKLKERVGKFEQKANELYKEVEEWTKSQFDELKKFIENHIRDSTQINGCSEAVNNLKQMLCKAKSDISLNYQSKEHLLSYCLQIEEIQTDLNDAINEQETAEDMAESDAELDLKLKHIGNEIKDSIKNQVNQLMKGFICE